MMATTIAYAEMKEFAKGWERIYRSAVCSGIVGDKRHTTGYHKGRSSVGRNDYSVIRPDDRGGPHDGSSAVDMTMGRTDMITATKRLASAYSNSNDPRRKYINAFNGWTGGRNAIRYDVYARKTKAASSDHKWHVHLEQRRRYIRDRTANEAIWSILRGESVAQWLARKGIAAPKPAPPASKPGAPQAPKPAPKAPPYPGRVLRRNDRQRQADPAVRMWQNQMRARGWTSIGKADGFAGPAFERTVSAWQKHCKLAVDGTVGPKTWPTPWTRPIGS